MKKSALEKLVAIAIKYFRDLFCNFKPTSHWGDLSQYHGNNFWPTDADLTPPVSEWGVKLPLFAMHRKKHLDRIASQSYFIKNYRILWKNNIKIGAVNYIIGVLVIGSIRYIHTHIFFKDFSIRKPIMMLLLHSASTWVNLNVEQRCGVYPILFIIF